MMKYLILTLSLIAATASLRAQFTWINPLPQGNTLQAIHFIDAHNGWAAGDCGTLLKTADGGSNWQVVTSPFTYNLQGIFFLNQDHGWAVGDNGTVLIYTNGNWTSADPVTDQDLYDVAFTDTLHGMACGDLGILLYTDDGGHTWREMKNLTKKKLYAIHFPSETTGYIAGGGGTAGGPGVILKTTDAGKHWQVMVDDLNESLYDACFTDSLTGYAAGNFSLIMKTTDGGESWEILENPNIYSSNHIHSIYFTDTLTGFTADIYGSILKTVNAGQEWAELSYFSPGVVFDMAESHEGNLMMCGGGGMIVSSPDLGESFINHQEGYHNGLVNMFHLDAQTIYATGEEMLAKSFDGGLSWTFDSVPELDMLVSSHFLTEKTGFVLSYNGKFKTIDGGETWTEMNGPKADWLAGIYMKNEFEGYITGGGQSPGGITWATCLKTIDGMNWESLNVPADRALNRVYFANNDLGFILGIYGLMLRTTDGGETWATVDPGTNRHLYDMVFTDDHTGFIIGSLYQNGNVILRTDDSGETWNPVYSDDLSGFEDYLKKIRFFGSLSGYVVGNSGQMLKTSDGGETWERLQGFTSNYLSDIVLFNDTSGMVCGSHGTLASFGEFSSSTADTPWQQNICFSWPNPFTTSCKIRFFNPAAQQLTLEILDRGGKSVFSRQQYFGYGNAVFNVDDFSAPAEGIYFFSITGKNFRCPGKMLKVRQ